MREYTNFPKNINNNNIAKEVKKPKLYLVTSKIVNLFAIFVATISVSTFFATRYIGFGDIFFSANIFSTMVSVAIFIVILEIYGRKNTIKAFMAGAYAILLVFFISAFITDFNPTPIGYYQSSFINFHQTILFSVFVSYVLSFLVCVKVYLYMKDDLDVPYLWVKAVPAIIVSQIIYTISYYLIYHGFSNLDAIVLQVKNELYLKFFMMIVDILIIYFIISGIKSGFFDSFKNVFSSKIRYIDSYEHQPIKPVYEEIAEQRSIPYNKQMALEDYSAQQRSKRYLPEYSEENMYNDSPKEQYGMDNYQYNSQYKQMVEEVIPQLKRSRRNAPLEDNQEQTFNRSNRRTSRKAVRNSRPNKQSFDNQDIQDNLEDNVPSNNIDRNRSRPNRSVASRPNNRTNQRAPKIVAVNNSNASENNVNNFSIKQQQGNKLLNNQFAKKQPLFNNNSFINKTNQNNSLSNNNFGNNNSFGTKLGQQSQPSFFANKLTPNNKPNMNNMGGFGNMNRNNTWNKR